MDELKGKIILAVKTAIADNGKFDIVAGEVRGIYLVFSAKNECYFSTTREGCNLIYRGK